MVMRDSRFTIVALAVAALTLFGGCQITSWSGADGASTRSGTASGAEPGTGTGGGGGGTVVTHDPWFLEYKVVAAAPDSDGFVQCYGMTGAVGDVAAGDAVQVENMSAPAGVVNFPVNPDGSFNNDVNREMCVRGAIGDVILFTIYRDGTSTGVSIKKRVNYYSRRPAISATRVAATDAGIVYVGTSDQGLYICSANDSRLDDCGHLTTLNGLISNKVQVVAEGKDGTLWIGTNRGLSGYRNGLFANYSMSGADGERLPSLQVTALAYDSTAEQLWIGTDNGLCRLGANGIEDFSNRFGAAKQINQLFLAPDGGLWVSIALNGIYYLTKDGVSVSYDLSLVPIAAVPAGGIWLPCSNSVTRAVGANNVTSIVGTSDGGLWAGTQVGLFHFSASLKQFEEIVVPGADPAQAATDVCPSIKVLGKTGADETVWVGRQNVLAPSVTTIRRFNVTGVDMPLNGTLPSLKSPISSQVITTGDGGFWLGSADALYRFDIGGDNTVTVTTELDSTVAANIDYLAADGNRFWFSNKKAGQTGLHMMYLDTSDGTYKDKEYVVNAGLPGNAVSKLLLAQDNSMWISTDSGVTRFKCNTAAADAECKFTDVMKAGASVAFKASQLFEANGSVWATEKGIPTLLYRFESGSFVNMPATLADGTTTFLSSAVFSAAVVAPDGALWLGTGSSGLYRYREGETPNLTRFIKGTGACQLPGTSNAISGLAVAADGSVFVGTSSGLMRIVFEYAAPPAVSTMTCQKFTKVAAADSAGVLPDSSVGSIATFEDKVVVGTKAGLAIFYANGTHNGNIAAGFSFQNLTIAKDGTIWAAAFTSAGTPVGLKRVSLSGDVMTYTQDPNDVGSTGVIPSNKVTTIREATDGRIWVGCADTGTPTVYGGVAVIQGQAVVATYTTDLGLPNSNVRTIGEIRLNAGNNQMWVGTGTADGKSGGLALFPLE